ncbi:MAG: TolC family protein [Alphaproteobacteria bacterium]
MGQSRTMFCGHILCAVMLSSIIVISPLRLGAETLRDSVSAGLDNSDVLAAKQQSFVATRQAIGQAKSGKEITGTITLSDSELLRDSSSVSGGFKKRYSRSGSLVFSKTLADFGETDLKVDAARHSVDAARADYSSVEQSVIFSLITAHLDVIAAREEVSIRKSNIARLSAQRDAAQIRLANGSATPSDLAETDARLARAYSDEILTASALIDAEETYLSLTGLSAGQLATPIVPADMPLTILAAEQSAEQFHPDILSVIAAEKVARLQFPILEASVKPTLGLSLSASALDQTATSADKEELSATLTFSTPFLVTNSTRSLARKTLSSHNQSKFDVAEQKRKTRLAVRNAFRALHASKGQLDAVMSEITAAQLLAENAAIEVEFGVKTILDQLDAEQSLFDAKLRMAQTKQAVLLNAFKLVQAMGRLSPDLFDLIEKKIDLDLIPEPSSRYPYMLPISVGE